MHIERAACDRLAQSVIGTNGGVYPSNPATGAISRMKLLSKSDIHRLSRIPQ